MMNIQTSSSDFSCLSPKKQTKHFILYDGHYLDILLDPSSPDPKMIRWYVLVLLMLCLNMPVKMQKMYNDTILCKLCACEPSHPPQEQRGDTNQQLQSATKVSMVTVQTPPHLRHYKLGPGSSYMQLLPFRIPELLSEKCLHLHLVAHTKQTVEGVGDSHKCIHRRLKHIYRV